MASSRADKLAGGIQDVARTGKVNPINSVSASEKPALFSLRDTVAALLRDPISHMHPKAALFLLSPPPAEGLGAPQK